MARAFKQPTVHAWAWRETSRPIVFTERTNGRSHRRPVLNLSPLARGGASQWAQPSILHRFHVSGPATPAHDQPIATLAQDRMPAMAPKADKSEPTRMTHLRHALLWFSAVHIGH